MEIDDDLFEELIQKGKEALKVKQPEIAAEFLVKALKIKQDANVYIDLGNCYDDMGFTEQAITQYHKALVFDPKLWRSYYNIGLIKKKTGNYRKSILYFNKALQLKPDHLNAYYCISEAFLFLKEPHIAEVHIRTVLEKDSTNQKAKIFLGICYYYQGKYLETIKALLEGLLGASADDKATAYKHLGTVYFILKDTDNALKSWYSYLEFSDNFYTAYIEIGRIKGYEKKYTEALDWFEKALYAQPNNPNEVLFMISCVTETEDIAKRSRYSDIFTTAIAIKKRFCEQYPGSAQGYYSLAVTLWRCGALEECLQAVEQSLRIERNGGAYYQYFQVLLAMERPQDALKVCTQYYQTFALQHKSDIKRILKYAKKNTPASFYKQLTQKFRGN